MIGGFPLASAQKAHAVAYSARIGREQILGTRIGRSCAAGRMISFCPNFGGVSEPNLLHFHAGSARFRRNARRAETNLRSLHGKEFR
jgi:hypothetical protein